MGGQPVHFVQYVQYIKNKSQNAVNFKWKNSEILEVWKLNTDKTHTVNIPGQENSNSWLSGVEPWNAAAL
jgi:hypothetical protein